MVRLLRVAASGSGEGVLEHIKDIPVIILSSKAEVEDKIHLLNEGACDYITKPFSLMVLRARVNTALRRRAAGNSCRYEWGGFVFDFDRTKYSVSADGITQNVNMPWYDALLGAKYNIKLPDGSKKEIEIGECTKDGDTIELFDTGLEERGGLYRLRINHIVPDKLSDIEKESLQEMKAKIKESNK